MSIVDKVVAAVTPPESDQARAEARQKARDASESGSWLADVLDHHVRIEEAFDEVRNAQTAANRTRQQQALASILTAHCIAEEAVLYPALAQFGEKGHAVMAYTEQSAAKLQLGLLEYLAPTSDDYLDKLEHIRGAVLHHMYAEEGNWFLDLQDAAARQNEVRLGTRYREEFARYEIDVTGTVSPRIKSAPVGRKT